MKEEISFNDYDKVDIRIGTVVNLSKNEKARKPSLVLEVDFGSEIGIKKSSAQITDYYNKENLVGKQVIGVCNFPEKILQALNLNFLFLEPLKKMEK